ncbi:MAG: MG2 domain-containing protein, partial [Vicinamibacteria bacterium]|nr:MG2 domain-containing protein [Vicinamibacteria bacterium]
MSTSWASIVSRSSLSLFALLCASAVSAQEFYLSSQGIVMPGETATVSLSTRTLKSVDVRVYRLSDPAAFFRAQSNPHAPRPVTAGGGAPSGVSLTESVAEAGASALSRYRDLARAILDGDVREKVAGDLGIGTGETKVETARAGAPARAIPLLPGYALVRRFTHVIQRDQKEAWWRDETIPVFDQKAETGSYLVEVVAGPARAYTVALVSNLRFVAKQGPAEGAARLVFVAQADSGRPVAGARVTTLPTSEDAKKSAAPVAAVTDASGLASLPASTGTSTLLVSKDKDFLLSDVYFYNASEEWGEGAESPTHVSPGRAYIYTDRPIYRPDQQVFFKALLRVKDGEGRYTLAAAESAAVSVLDSQDRKIYEAKLAASDLGCLDGSLTLSSQPSLGSYTIKVAWQKRVDYGHFRVEEYKKPEFEVKVATDRERYITGDTLEIDVDAKYYFGDAVAGGKVEWEIYHAKYFRPWWEDYALRWFFASEQGYHTYDYEQLEQGEGTLDENGRLHVRLASRGRSGQDEVYRIVARVTDATNRQLSGVKIVPVAAGLFRIELDSERYAAGVGESLNLSVKTRTSEDQPTSERVQIVIERSIWEKGKTRKQTAESRVVTTDSTGAARFAFTPREPGSYSIQASAQDSRGNALASSYFFWAWSEKPWWSESSGEGLTLTPDKKVYAAGDTAALLLVSPVENPTVLFTIEGPRIFEQKVVTASGTTATIPIPIRDVYSPNVYATAAVIAGGKYYSQEALIVIPPKDRFLKIDIGTDRPVYRPGDKVALTLTVKDEQGQPVDAELSVGIVDLSIYALAPESAPDIKGFFYGQRPNEVSTSYSTDFSQYTSARSEARRKGDDLRWADFKSISQTRIRKVFKDTMFWQAVVRTGSSGVAQLP